MFVIQIVASLILSGDVESNPGPGDVEHSRSTRSKGLGSDEHGRSTRSCSVNLINANKVEQKQRRKSVHFEVIYVLFEFNIC